ncbi:hypothetical protein B0H19DRAFT_1057577 [Mycena capillaripes]|nr:hypothetical protein B0H19DRAFT_1057577 [Mycena capillaripes]
MTALGKFYALGSDFLSSSINQPDYKDMSTPVSAVEGKNLQPLNGAQTERFSVVTAFVRNLIDNASAVRGDVPVGLAPLFPGYPRSKPKGGDPQEPAESAERTTLQRESNPEEAVNPNAPQESIAVESTVNHALQLTPHPCTFPLPPFVAAHGITCITRTFLVDILPASYPYLPFRCSSSPNAKFQIPFFQFSGPDPPPANIGSPGDIYVAPAASALYARLPVPVPVPVNGGDGVDGGVSVVAHAWTPWTAVAYEAHRREIKLTEPGLLHHPFFPAHVLWAAKNAFAWYSLSTVNNTRREVRTKRLFGTGASGGAGEGGDGEAGRDAGMGAEAGEAAKVLVALTLQNAADKSVASKGREREKGQGTNKRPIAKTNPDERYGPGPGPPKKARRVSVLSSLSADATVSVQDDDGNENANANANEKDWTAFYAKPRTSTRRTKEAERLAGLEAENASLRAAVEEAARAREALNSALAVISMQQKAQEKEEQQENEKAEEPPRMPFHPEFLDFMRETFAREVVKACNEQRTEAESAAADGMCAPFFPETCALTKVQGRARIAVLETKIAALEAEAKNTARSESDAMEVDVNADTRTRTRKVESDKGAGVEGEASERIAELEAALARDHHDYTLRMAQHNVALCAAETKAHALERRVEELEGEVARMTRAAEKETDALRQLLAARAIKAQSQSQS